MTTLVPGKTYIVNIKTPEPKVIISEDDTRVLIQVYDTNIVIYNPKPNDEISMSTPMHNPITNTWNLQVVIRNKISKTAESTIDFKKDFLILSQNKVMVRPNIFCHHDQRELFLTVVTGDLPSDASDTYNFNKYMPGLSKYYLPDINEKTQI